jgi:UPF0755 protein
MPRRAYLIVSLVLLLFVILAAAAGLFYRRWFARPHQGRTVTVYLYKGHSFQSLTRELQRRKLAPKNWLFNKYLRLTLAGKVPKAGEYELKTGMSLLDLLRRVEKGRVKIRRFAIIPGWRVGQLFHRMRQKSAFEPQQLTDKTVTAALGIARKNPEGLFFPATYRFYWGSPAMNVLRKSHEKMQAVLKAEWKKRAPGLPYQDAYQALIAASLIEKESHAREERAMIARVILNRLHKGMRLQIDPTVLYAWRDQNLYRVTHRMLKIDSPYNTYRRKGLPPTPICLPERSSIHAALHPAHSDALFYVALGDGIHHRFSKTYDQHLGYVKDYRERLAAQRKNSLLDFPITLHQFEHYWQTHCELIHYWLPFIAGLGTLSEQSGWMLFPVESHPHCHTAVPKKTKAKSIQHGPKQRTKSTIHQHRRHRGSR